MSRESAIEAIGDRLFLWFGWHNEPKERCKAGAERIIELIAEHGFVHLDDVAEGWREGTHTHVAGRDGDIDKCHKCGLDLRNPIHFRADYVPATIREVLSDLAVRKEA